MTSRVRTALSLAASPGRARRIKRLIQVSRMERARRELAAGTTSARRRRDFFLFRAGRFTSVVGAETEDAFVLLSPFDRGKQLELFVERRLEAPALASALAIAAQRSDGAPLADRVLLDVGAHIGLSTLVAVRRHGVRRVLCVEAEPGNRRLLRANLAMNAHDAEVRIAPVAASSARGSARLSVNPTMHGKHALVAQGAGAAGTVEVPTAPLDELVVEHGHRLEDIGFVKIDTEGHEPSVLAGATGLLALGVPAMIEFAPGRYSDAEFATLSGLVVEHYRLVVDLRTAATADAEPTAVDAGVLDALRARYAGGAGPRVTDLLLLR